MTDSEHVGAGAPAESALRQTLALRPLRRMDRWALAILVAAAVVLVVTAWRVGPTYDEHFYIVSGMSYWSDGDFSLNREHPPLLKLLAGLLPTLIGPVALPADHAQLFNLPGSFFFQTAGEHWHTLLFLGRLPMCALTLLGGLAVYLASLRWFGLLPARVALLACVGNPNVLAHGPLAALDMGCAAAMTIAVVAWIAVLRQGSPQRRLVAGLAIGLACATKFTALALWPIVIGTALARALSSRSLEPIRSALWVAPLALTAFAACYGFEARTIDSVRRNQLYTGDRHVVDVGPEALTDALVESAGPQATAGLEPLIAAMRESHSTTDALEGWLVEMRRCGGPSSDDHDRLRDLMGALEVLESAPARLRKKAFKAVLEAERPEPAWRADLLCKLAGADVLVDRKDPLAPWRTHWENEARADWDLVVLGNPLLSGVVRGVFGEFRPVPLLTALAGLDQQLAQSRTGHASYYRGRTYLAEDFESGAGVPLYYFDVLLHKLPLAFVLLFVLGVITSTRRTPRWGRLDALVVLGTIALLLALFATSNALMGVRYVLPVLPLLALTAGRAALAAPRLATSLVVLGVLESIWIHPHHLMYYNLLAGGPWHGTLITVSGDDWGQDAAGLGVWMAEHAELVHEAGALYYDPYLEADPIALGLGESLPLVRNAVGLVAVSVAELRRDPKRYAWLDDKPVVATVGYTISIYDTRPKPVRRGGQH